MPEQRSSSHRKLRPVGLADVRWTDGFWADRFRTCAESSIPAMYKRMSETERHRWLGNFEVASGLAEGRYRGPKWNDGDFYKWLEGAAAVLAVAPDAELEKIVDNAIALIAGAQQPDGYIHSPVTIAQKVDPAAPRFGNPMDFEMYNHGHLISAAVAHHLATGKRTLLDPAIKAADFLDRQFANPTPEVARHGICPSHLMALTQLYRLTGEPRYKALAQRLLNMRDLVVKGDDDNQDRIPLREHRTAHGHAVRATYLYAGAADVYAETGDDTLLPALDAVWNDLATTKLYLTGGCGALYDGASPDGSADQLNITRVHQAFGRAYQLPQSVAHNETCAAVGNLLWTWRMLQITGDAKYAELAEWTFYNSVLAGVSLDGVRYFYTNTLRRLDPMPVNTRFPHERQETLGCYCCPPNVVRTVAQASSYAYCVSDDGVWCGLYGSSDAALKLGNHVVRLKQETNYPWSGDIRITVVSSDAPSFALHVRVPRWATANDQIATCRVNGEPVRIDVGFTEVRRAWKAGDVIEISLSMPARIVEANPFVEEARNHVAVVRGPIVYCLENADLPADVRLLDAALPRGAKLQPATGEGVLASITVLEGPLVVRASRGDWSGELYRDADDSAEPRRIAARFIPYFAWDNRGPTEMSVWIPRDG